MVRRHRANDDRVQFAGLDAALLERRFGGLHSHVGRRHLGRGDVALADSGALQNPLVGGIHHLLEVLVRQNLRWHIATVGADFDVNQWTLSFGRSVAPHSPHPGETDESIGNTRKTSLLC